MINKETVKNLVDSYIGDKDIFLVDIRISTTNKITVLVNRPSGITIDECAAMSRYIEAALDRDEEDFELSVSSPGLSEAFKVREQFEMNIGNTVEVVDREGKKVRGVLKNVAGEGFEVDAEKKPGGKKGGKKTETEEVSYNFDEVKSVKEKIRFK
ncbi:MAG: ribosome assembly cofactor RimP [Bacteroidales bacterium]|nr:ribosome assembly cofactor RimP [Bacteroidales bacterium]